MSQKQFDDNCPGCRPVLIDPVTGTKFEDSHPIMQMVDRVWAATTRQEREAFHNVCCNNSRKQSDMEQMSAIVQKIESLAKASNH
jgi:hypothetical protein